MHNFSCANGGKLLGTDIVVLGLQLFSLQELSLDILDYLGFEKLTGRRNQCPSAATKHSLSGRTSEGVFLHANSARWKSVPVTLDFFSRFLAVLIAFSALPLLCGYCGELVICSMS